MSLEKKIAGLNHIYGVYDKFAREWKTECKLHCTQCCTINVTLTSLEAFKITQYLINNHKIDLLKKLKSDKKRFQPIITTNELVDICIQGKDIPDEEADPKWGICPFLENQECPIYEVRPFGCRCMVSAKNCNETGYADMEPFIVTMNNVFLQYIEHIDAGGYYGNLTDMLQFMEFDENRKNYQNQTFDKSNNNLIINHPVKALMIPPEHRTKMQPVIQELNNVNF